MRRRLTREKLLFWHFWISDKLTLARICGERERERYMGPRMGAISHLRLGESRRMLQIIMIKCWWNLFDEKDWVKCRIDVGIWQSANYIYKQITLICTRTLHGFQK